MTNYNSTSGELIFTEIYTNNYSKIFCLTFSISVVVFSTPFLYWIHKFERDNPFRILHNQILTLMLLEAISYNFTVQTTYIFLYLFGPQPPIICFINFVLQGAFTLLHFVLMNAVMIVRYIFTFHLKNPTATEHDFWVVFLAIWSFGFGIIASFVYAYLPGRNPSTNYVCLGKVTKEQMTLFPKIHYPMTILVLLTIFINSSFGVRMFIFKQIPLAAATESPVRGCYRHQNIQNAKNYMVSFTSSFGFVIMYFVIPTPSLLALTSSLDKIETFPYYISVYYFHLCVGPLYASLTVLILLIKNNAMRAFVYRHIVNLFRF